MFFKKEEKETKEAPEEKTETESEEVTITLPLLAPTYLNLLGRDLSGRLF